MQVLGGLADEYLERIIRRVFEEAQSSPFHDKTILLSGHELGADVCCCRVCWECTGLQTINLSNAFHASGLHDCGCVVQQPRELALDLCPLLLRCLGILEGCELQCEGGLAGDRNDCRLRNAFGGGVDWLCGCDLWVGRRVHGLRVRRRDLGPALPVECYLQLILDCLGSSFVRALERF